MTLSETVRKWTRNQWKAIRWFAADKFARTPETETALAHAIGVSPRTLYRWKQIDEFWEEVRDLSRQQFRQDVAQYYAALTREAIKGNFQHLNLAMQMAGEVAELGSEKNPQVVVGQVTYITENRDAGND